MGNFREMFADLDAQEREQAQQDTIPAPAPGPAARHVIDPVRQPRPQSARLIYYKPAPRPTQPRVVVQRVPVVVPSPQPAKKTFADYQYKKKVKPLIAFNNVKISNTNLSSSIPTKRKRR